MTEVNTIREATLLDPLESVKCAEEVATTYEVKD